MKKVLMSLLLIPLFSGLIAQSNYTSYFTGNQTDLEVSPTPGTVLMGGATEDDNAMIWFLERANGGDVLVIRASGSNGYNDYLYSELGVSVNSVETIVFDGPMASQEPYVLDKLAKAEAIWIAGGDQWNYIDYWRDSPVQEALQNFIDVKQGVIGGTSAGMAVLGGVYFKAQNGTVLSDEALANPFNIYMSLGFNDFLSIEYTKDVITDTHYDDPDRKGRHVAFMSRMMDAGIDNPKGIASEEYTAVCIEPNGIAHVYGEYPEFEDYAYFVRLGCEDEKAPEVLESNTPLTWNRNGEALAVYKLPGTVDGSTTFDLNDWHTGSGGSWERWYVQDGVLTINDDSSQPDCSLTVRNISIGDRFKLYPNPSNEKVYIETTTPETLIILDNLGRVLMTRELSGRTQIDTSDWQSGVYIFRVADAVRQLVVFK